jgi:uncharacterized protein (DUF1810 family)
MPGGDPFGLQRFVDAQAGGVYEAALAELQRGHKSGHWIWFIFPQHRNLGRSGTAKFDGLSGAEEAAAYLAHPVLGPRLRECVAAVAEHLRGGRSAEAILGDLDAMKLRSSLQIFGLELPGLSHARSRTRCTRSPGAAKCR